MPSFSALAVLSSLVLASVSVARPIPHTVTLFRRAILDANDGILVVEHQDAPKSYAPGLEPYDRYHFRFMAVGCPDYDHNQVFFETCCHPRSAKKQSDSAYPAACRLDSYLVFNPVYSKGQTVAKLGSLLDYKNKMHYDNDDVSSSVAPSSSVSSSSSASETTEAYSSSASASSTWSSSAPAYTPSSSSTPAYTPAYTPSSSSSTWSSPAPVYTPSSSSESWSSSSSSWSSSSSSWTPSSSSEAPAPTWSSSSSYSAPTSEWQAPPVAVAKVATSSSSSWTPPAAPAPTAQSSNNGGQTFSGTGSWYTQDGNAGACGVYHSDSDYIVAMAAANYGNIFQKSPHCGQTITITNTNTGATANAIVADACPGCSSEYSLDLSTGLFSALASLDQGLTGTLTKRDA